jgi:hypothetical protein
MKTISMIGSFVVTLALVFYSIGFTKENRKKLVTGKVLLFYTIGVCLDISATIMMILGSSKGMITPHGLIGYSSLLGMLIDTSLLWRHNLSYGPETQVKKSLYTYSRIAFIWWVLAYITGGLLVAVSKMKG